jgi:hypothetical protein
MQGWVSPFLQVRFEVVDGDLHIYGPDGKEFVTYVELAEQRESLMEQRTSLLEQRETLATERDKERLAKDQAEQRAERLAAQLKALGIDPEA